MATRGATGAVGRAPGRRSRVWYSPRARCPLAAWFPLLLVGCLPPGAGDTAATTRDSGRPGTGDSTGDSVGSAPELTAVDCATVSFGDPALQPALWVDGSATASGDGSPSAPMVSIADALAVVGDAVVIWVEEGVYTGGLSLDVPGLAVVGRGTQTTRLVARYGAANVESNPGEGRGNALCALSLEGGAPGVMVRSGDLSLFDVAVSGAVGEGVSAQGDGRSLRLDGVTVRHTALGNGLGVGVVVDRGATAEIANSNVSDNDGIGMLARHSGTRLSVRDSRVDGNGLGAPENAAGGVWGQRCDDVTLDRVVLDGNMAVGIFVATEGSSTIVDSSVTGTTAVDDAALGIHVVSSLVAITRTDVRGGTGAGIAIHRPGADLTDVSVRGVEVGAGDRGGVGILLHDGVEATSTRVDASGNARVGLWMERARLECRDCEFSDNGEVGLIYNRSTLTLDGAVVVDNGYAGMMWDGTQPDPITVRNSTFGPHPYAAIWAWNSLSLEDSTVYGSGGIQWEGAVANGFAVFVEGSDDALSGNVFVGAESVAVLGAGFGGDLSGNTWHNAGTDFVAIHASGTVSIGGLDEIPEYEINPSPGPVVVAPPVDVEKVARGF